MEYQLPASVSVRQYHDYGNLFTINDSYGKPIKISRNNAGSSVGQGKRVKVDEVTYLIKGGNNIAIKMTRDQLIDFMQAIVVCISETEALYE